MKWRKKYLWTYCSSCFLLFVFLVPPLEGFVMNRVQGDYFETLLYKIFVSIDEQTNVTEVGFVCVISTYNNKFRDYWFYTWCRV